MTDKTMTLATELRRVCGHDSRSVDGCLHCEAADALEHRHLSQPAERGEAQEKAAPVAETGRLYVEARQCEDCDHLGINDSSDTGSACGDCEWQGPTPDEDKCPGCARHNCMAVACPICGGRYRFLADRWFSHDAAPPPAAGVPDELVRMTIRALDDVDTEMRATGRATNRFSQLASDWRGMLSATPSPTIDVAAVHGFHGFEIVENASVPEGEVWFYDKTKLPGDLIRTHAAEIERNAMIAEAALKWWQEHQYDVASSDAGDGCIDECNVYDEPPEFVKIAMRGCGE